MGDETGVMLPPDDGESRRRWLVALAAVGGAVVLAVVLGAVALAKAPDDRKNGKAGDRNAATGPAAPGEGQRPADSPTPPPPSPSPSPTNGGADGPQAPPCPGWQGNGVVTTGQTGLLVPAGPPQVARVCSDNSMVPDSGPAPNGVLGGPGDIEQLVAALRALEPAQPDLACVTVLGATFTILLVYPDGKQVAVYGHTGDCGYVWSGDQDRVGAAEVYHQLQRLLT